MEIQQRIEKMISIVMQTKESVVKERDTDIPTHSVSKFKNQKRGKSQEM